jgi:hypothetical protein
MKLLTRDEAGDLSHIYGTDWHTTLPVVRPGLVVKIGIKGKEVTEWPWGLVKAIREGGISVEVDETVFADDHGVHSGDEIIVNPEHIHMFSWLDLRALN